MIDKLDVSGWSAFEQSVLDILIKGGVFTVLLLLNFLIAGLSGGSIQLPYAVWTLPALTLLLSQFDSYVIAWAKTNNDPIPPQAPQQ